MRFASREWSGAPEPPGLVAEVGFSLVPLDDNNVLLAEAPFEVALPEAVFPITGQAVIIDQTVIGAGIENEFAAPEQAGAFSPT